MNNIRSAKIIFLGLLVIISVVVVDYFGSKIGNITKLDENIPSATSTIW